MKEYVVDVNCAQQFIHQITFVVLLFTTNNTSDKCMYVQFFNKQVSYIQVVSNISPQNQQEISASRNLDLNDRCIIYKSALV